jgi:hypothetical protein
MTLPALAALIMEHSPADVLQGKKNHRLSRRQLAIDLEMVGDRLLVTVIFTGTKRYPPMRLGLRPIEIASPLFDPTALAEHLGVAFTAHTACAGFNWAIKDHTPS